MNGRVSVEHPTAGAGCGVDSVEPAVVRSDVHCLVPECRSRVDVRSGVGRPEQVPGGGTEGIHVAVRVPGKDAAVPNRHRRVEVLAATEPRVRLRTPYELSGPCLDRVDASAVCAEVHAAAPVCGRTLDFVIRLEPPAQARTRPSDVECVQVVVPRAEVERVPDHERRRLDGAGTAVPPQQLAVARAKSHHLPRLRPRVPLAWVRLHQRDVEAAARSRRR